MPWDYTVLVDAIQNQEKRTKYSNKSNPNIGS